jgi:leucyl-tRNA synthetase
MINGKPRDNVIASADIEQDDAIAMALETDGAKRALNGGKAKKVIFIPGRKGQEPKVNIVV